MGGAGGDEGDDRPPRDRMLEDAGIDHRRLNSAVGAGSRDDDEAVVLGDELGEGGEIAHHQILAQGRNWSARGTNRAGWLTSR